MTYLLLTLVFTAAVTAAFSIPTSAIEHNVSTSVDEVTAGGKMFTAHAGPWEPWKLGSFSDCVILGIAYMADSIGGGEIGRYFTGTLAGCRRSSTAATGMATKSSCGPCCA